MKTLFNNLLLLLLLILPFVSACDQDDEPAPPQSISTAAELTNALAGILAQNAAPGFALTIVSNDAIIYQEAFGQAEVANETPFTNQTVQPLASVSKTFVGAATAKAIALGLFELETDINDLLPVSIVNPKQPDAVIQVKHLLTHTSGLLDNPSTYFVANYSILPGQDINTPGARMLTDQLGILQRPSRSLEDYLADYLLVDGDFYSLDNFADATTGSSWSYSNMGTALMAYLIEQAAEQPFHLFVKEQVLEPLGMNTATYQLEEVDLAQLNHWYFDRNTPFPYYDNDSYAEGNLFTSNTELGYYLLDMVHGSQGQSNLLFSSDYYDLLFSDQLPAGQVPADFGDNHSLFWIKDGSKYRHGGNSFGVSAYLEVDPARAQGYSFMTNLDAVFNQQSYNQLSSAIADAINSFLAAN